MSLWVTVTCAGGADCIKRSICRLVVNAVSKNDRGKGNRDAFFCLNQALGQMCEHHRCVWSPQGLDYLTITTSSVLPSLLFFFFPQVQIQRSDLDDRIDWQKTVSHLHLDILKESTYSLQVWPPAGQCQQIKRFLDELGSCSSRCVYISSALFTGNLKPKAESFRCSWERGEVCSVHRRSNYRIVCQCFMMDLGRSAAISRLI